MEVYVLYEMKLLRNSRNEVEGDLYSQTFWRWLNGARDNPMDLLTLQPTFFSRRYRGASRAPAEDVDGGAWALPRNELRRPGRDSHVIDVVGAWALALPFHLGQTLDLQKLDRFVIVW